MSVIYFIHAFYLVPIPVAARSKAWVCGHLLTGIVGSNPSGAWMSVSCTCILSGAFLVGIKFMKNALYI